MATISENLQILKDSTDAIKQAIIDKGGVVTGDITTWANAINGLSGGGENKFGVFSVEEGGTWVYEIGMTWEEWFNSDYIKMEYAYNNYTDYFTKNGGFVGYFKDTIGICYISPMEDSQTTISITSKIDPNISMYYCVSVSCCFASGTKITMNDGTYKNIEEIKVGDEVLSYNINDNIFYTTVVKNLIVKPNVHTIADVVFENGEKLTMNEYHPILTERGWHSLTRYNNYDELVIGDNCKTDSGWSKIISIDKYSSEEGVKMYNLDVVDKNETLDTDLNDNFIANNIVVHNSYC